MAEEVYTLRSGDVVLREEMGKGCQYHLEIQCANQVRIK